MKRKIIFLFVMFILLPFTFFLSACDKGSSNPPDNPQQEFKFEEYGNGYALSDYLGTSTSIVVPSTYNGKNVIAIGMGKKDGINYIGDGFFKCYDVKHIFLPNTIKEINSFSFAYCTSLESISIPNCKIFGYNVFQDCHNLTSIEIPEDCVSLSDNLFKNCSKLINVTINGGSLCKDLFSGCNSIKTLKLGDNVTIASESFRPLLNLENLYIPNLSKSISEIFGFKSVNTYVYNFAIPFDAISKSYYYNGTTYYYTVPVSGTKWMGTSQWIVNGNEGLLYLGDEMEVSSFETHIHTSSSGVYLATWEQPKYATIKCVYIPKTLQNIYITNAVVDLNSLNYSNLPFKIIVGSKIKYEMNGGLNSSLNPTSYNKFNSLTLHKPTRQGYIFLGWTGANGNVPQKDITIPAGTTGDRTYIANWEAKITGLSVTNDNLDLYLFNEYKYSFNEQYNYGDNPLNLNIKFTNQNDLPNEQVNNYLEKIEIFEGYKNNDNFYISSNQSYNENGVLESTYFDIVQNKKPLYFTITPRDYTYTKDLYLIIRIANKKLNLETFNYSNELINLEYNENDDFTYYSFVKINTKIIDVNEINLTTNNIAATFSKIDGKNSFLYSNGELLDLCNIIKNVIPENATYKEIRFYLTNYNNSEEIIEFNKETNEIEKIKINENTLNEQYGCFIYPLKAGTIKIYASIVKVDKNGEIIELIRSETITLTFNENILFSNFLLNNEEVNDKALNVGESIILSFNVSNIESFRQFFYNGHFNIISSNEIIVSSIELKEEENKINITITGILTGETIVSCKFGEEEIIFNKNMDKNFKIIVSWLSSE